MKIGYHASHEQFTPRDLVTLVARAEQNRFDGVMSSDHFSPFSEDQGQSGYAWAWLGAAMAGTTLPFGTVSAPGYRYHPAVLAQAAATISQIYPDRLWVALGSGEFINEHITGGPWPRIEVRRESLRECATIIRALLAGETVSHEGLVRVNNAKLYTLPERPPLLMGAAVSPEGAKSIASWADGLITVNQPIAKLREVIATFRANGGEGKIIRLQMHLAWAPEAAEAQAAAHAQWRTAAIGAPLAWDAPSAAHLDAAARFIRPEDLTDVVCVSSDLGQQTAWIAAYFELGFDEIYLHEVGKNQRRFIDVFGEKVLPRLR